MLVCVHVHVRVCTHVFVRVCVCLRVFIHYLFSLSVRLQAWKCKTPNIMEAELGFPPPQLEGDADDVSSRRPPSDPAKTHEAAVLPEDHSSLR